MKIWFDTKTQLIGDHDVRNNRKAECDWECSGDCDCAIRDDYRTKCDWECADDCNECSSSSLYLRNLAQDIQTITFQAKAFLKTKIYDDEHWLVCDSTGSGQVVVLDQQAFVLLNQFCRPTTLTKLIQHDQSISVNKLEQLVELFYRLGLLQDFDHRLPVHHLNRQDALSAWLHMTNACNLRCHYCYLQKTSEHMRDDIARRSVDAILRSAVRHQYQRVYLKYAGGEASLQLNNLLAIHDYTVQQAHYRAISLYATLLSNGVALTQRAIDQLRERQIHVTISLDGIGASHDTQRILINGQGSFKYVDRTITRLLASSFAPYINITVSQRNLDGLAELVEYLLDRELRFTFSYYRDNDCSATLRDLQYTEERMIATMRAAFGIIEQHLPRQRLIDSLIDKASLNTPHQHTCAVGRSYLVIDQHGGIAKCQADIKRTVTTIDAEDPLQVIRDDRSGVQGLSVDEKEGCRVCQWRYWCTGGCPLLTHRLTGRYDIKSPNCNIYKALFPEVLRLEALRLLKYTSPITF
jgi:uncharacterized protein